MDRVFSIQFVSKITGINAHTIRAWEKRYGAVVPKRSENGKRIYSQENVDRLKKLNELVKLGNAISDVAKLDEKELTAMYLEFVEEGETYRESPSVEEVNIEETIKCIFMALQSYKLDILSYEMDKLRKSLTERDFALNVAVRLINEMNVLVSEKIIENTQKNILLSSIKFNIGHYLAQNRQERKQISIRIVIAALVGDLSEVKIMISALLCSHYNLTFYYIGANLSAQELVLACNKINPDYTILGGSLKAERHSGNIFEEYIEKVLTQTKERNKIILCKELSHYEPRVEALGSIHELDDLLAQINQSSAA